LGAGTLDTAGSSLTVTVGVTIGSPATGAAPFSVIGGGSINLTSGASTLDNVTLEASVLVNGGNPTVGQISFAGAATQRWFVIQAGTATFGYTAVGGGGVAGTFTSSIYGGAYYQPIDVKPGGIATFNGAYVVKGFIYNEGGTVNVNPGTTLTVTGDSGPKSPAPGTPGGFSSGYLSTGNNATLALAGATFNERDSNALSAVYIQATDSLKIVGSTSSAINGNVFAVGGTVNGTRTTASIEFVGPDSTDGLIVSGNLTLGTAQVNVNLTYPAPAPAAMGQGVTPDATAPAPCRPSIKSPARTSPSPTARTC
jgi:hypothetical protein